MTDEKYGGYRARLDQEYRDYLIGLSRSSPQEIVERVDEIRAVKHAYEYLCSTDISREELEYVMGAVHPLQEITGQHEAFRSAQVQENPVAQTVYDIWDKRLFSDGVTPLFTDRVPIRFHRKVGSIAEILSLPRNREDHPFLVEKVINLASKDFAVYASTLLTDQPFITENQDLMCVDEAGCWHCILVQDEAAECGLLICADGDMTTPDIPRMWRTRGNFPSKTSPRRITPGNNGTGAASRSNRNADPLFFFQSPFSQGFQSTFRLKTQPATSGPEVSAIGADSAGIAPMYIGTACREARSPYAAYGRILCGAGRRKEAPCPTNNLCGICTSCWP